MAQHVLSRDTWHQPGAVRSETTLRLFFPELVNSLVSRLKGLQNDLNYLKAGRPVKFAGLGNNFCGLNGESLSIA